MPPQPIGSRRVTASTELRKTPLHALHVSLGARMVPFAGYDMPVQYPDGIIKEHLHTRAAGRAVRRLAHGPGDARRQPIRRRALERLTPADSRPQGRPAALCAAAERRRRHQGRFHGRRACRPSARFISSSTPRPRTATSPISPSGCSGVAELKPLPSRALLALQGPMAEAVLARHDFGGREARLHEGRRASRSPARPRSSAARATPARTGSRSRSPRTKPITSPARFCAEAEVKPIGLGARDSLRLEAGLCLYGHDIDETTTPIEADLAFSIGKRRKMARDFPGAERLMARAARTAPKRKRVGIRCSTRCPRAKAPRSSTRRAASSAASPAAASGRAVGAPDRHGLCRRPNSRADGTRARRDGARRAAAGRGRADALRAASLQTQR